MPSDPALIALAKQAAATHGLDPSLVCAVIEQESDWQSYAVRYEPAFMSKYIAPEYIKGGMAATEAYCRSMSWGLMQLMGQGVRELGFEGPFLSELCNPPVGLDWGCKKLAKLLERAKGDTAQALLFWNGGANKSYPAEVLARMDNYQETK